MPRFTTVQSVIAQGFRFMMRRSGLSTVCLNVRLVIRLLGLVTAVLSFSILAVACWSSLQFMMGDRSEAMATRALLESVLLGLVVAFVLFRLGRGDDDFLGPREALLLVALSWLAGAALAGLPYFLWSHLVPTDPALAGGDAAGMTQAAVPFRSFVNCYFEAMSGLTTTGATVLSQIEPIPRGLLLWRAMTHWLGGLGIVVLFVAVLPTLGVGGKKLFRVEAPGPTTPGVRPRIRETARLLWLIYVGLTVALIIALQLCGMDWYESVCHTFATLATGGFSTRNASVGQYDSVAIDTVMIVFMMLAGINFGLYYRLSRRQFRSVWRDPELRLYLGLIFIATVIVGWSLMKQPIVTTTGKTYDPTMGQALRFGLFQVVSIQTTTGYCTANFETWGFFPKAALIGLMFVGGSAGSTGGGLKVIRCLIALKVVLAEIERVFNPNAVRTIKVGSTHIDPDLRLSTMVYILGIVALFLVGALLLMLFEPAGSITFTTAATASIATLNNIGPGLEAVGAVENYGWFSDSSKVVLSLLMALGRLEVYAILVLFVPRFWQGR